MNNLSRSVSLKHQFIMVYASVVLVCIILFSSGVFFIMSNEMKRSTQQALRYEYDYLSQQFSESIYDKQDASMLLSARSMEVSGFHVFKYAVYDSDKYLIAQSDGFPERLMQMPVDDMKYAAVNHQSASGWMVDKAKKNFFVHLVSGEDTTRYVTVILLKTILYSLPVGLIIAFVGGWFAAKSMLKRLKGLSMKVSQLKLGQSNRLDISGNNDELDQLSSEFNKLLDRIESDYQRVVKFTADASHELRLPITAIKGEAEVVLSRARDVEDYRKCLSDILEEFDRLSSLIQRLLQLARSDSGVDLPEKKTVDIYSVTEKVVEFFEPVAESKNTSLHLIPTDALTVSLDVNRYREMLSNLIDNALKYTADNGRIEVRMRRLNDTHVEISVTDNGIGIPADEQSRIFDRFHRVSKARERTGAGGDGLGLAIAQSIAKIHGGEITVESAPMKGSTFTIHLPLN